MPDLFFRWGGIFLEEVVRGQDDARCAEAALQPVLFFEGLLYRVGLAIARQAFDSGDFASICLDGKHCAGFCCNAVDQDRTGTTLTGIAAHVRPG